MRSIMIASAAMFSCPAMPAASEWRNSYKTDAMTDVRQASASAGLDVPCNALALGGCDRDATKMAYAGVAVRCLDGRLELQAHHFGMVGVLQSGLILYRFDNKPHRTFRFDDVGFGAMHLFAWADESPGHEHLLYGLMGGHNRLLVRFNADAEQFKQEDVEFGLDGAAEAMAKAAAFGGCDLSEYVNGGGT